MAYRPNPPSEGPFTVYTQHRTYFNTINNNRCPRIAFVEDLIVAIQEPIHQGDNIIIMLDGNEDMREGYLAEEFKKMNLREVIMGKHGTKTPSTFDRNSNNIPINRIWSTPNISITVGGYMSFNEVFEKTNHRTLWVALSICLDIICSLLSSTRLEGFSAKTQDAWLIIIGDMNKKLHNTTFFNEQRI
jgi:hypothetical protein